MELLELAKRYDVRAPRYTSYPTAAEFHAGIGGRDYARAIRSTNADAVPAPLGLYLHLPFCRSLCYYCACTKIVTRHPDKVRHYHSVLAEEAALIAPLFAADREVEEIHLGGGTPTYLPPSAIAELIGALGEEFSFAPAQRRNWAIEIDPRTVSPDDLAALREVGFNRLSMGIQDFEPRVQAAINRIQTFESVSELMDAARAAAFDSVNFDLVYGLPWQNAETLARTLDQVVSLAPDRIALYAYAHLPSQFRAQRLIPESALARGPARLALLVGAIRRLHEAGYVYIGMDHFARPDDALARGREAGSLVRNFQGYAPGPGIDLVGLGMSAISSLGGVYAQNAKEPAQWEAAVSAGQLPTARGYRLTPEDLLRRDVIQGVMCRDRVEFEEFERRYGIEFGDHFAEELAGLAGAQNDGLVRVLPDALEITPTGRLFLRAIAAVFDTRLSGQQSKSRFSRVV